MFIRFIRKNEAKRKYFKYFLTFQRVCEPLPCPSLHLGHPLRDHPAIIKENLNSNALQLSVKPPYCGHPFKCPDQTMYHYYFSYIHPLSWNHVYYIYMTISGKSFSSDSAFQRVSTSGIESVTTHWTIQTRYLEFNFREGKYQISLPSLPRVYSGLHKHVSCKCNTNTDDIYLPILIEFGLSGTCLPWQHWGQFLWSWWQRRSRWCVGRPWILPLRSPTTRGGRHPRRAALWWRRPRQNHPSWECLLISRSKWGHL